MASLRPILLGTTSTSGIIMPHLEKIEYLPPGVKHPRIVKEIKVLASPISRIANGAMKENLLLMALLILNIFGTTSTSGIIMPNLEKKVYLTPRVKLPRIFLKCTSPSFKHPRIVKEIKVLPFPISRRANGAMKEN